MFQLTGCGVTGPTGACAASGAGWAATTALGPASGRSTAGPPAPGTPCRMKTATNSSVPVSAQLRRGTCREDRNRIILSRVDPEPLVGGNGLLIFYRGDVEVGYEPKSKESFTGIFSQFRFAQRASPIIVLNPHQKNVCFHGTEYS